MLINRLLERIDTLILDAHSAMGRKVLSSDEGSQKGFLEEDLRGQLDTHVRDPCSMRGNLRRQDTFKSMGKAFMWLELGVEAE